MKKNKNIIEMKVICWTKKTRAEQDKALFHLIQLISDLSSNYRKNGISDDFTASY